MMEMIGLVKLLMLLMHMERNKLLFLFKPKYFKYIYKNNNYFIIYLINNSVINYKKYL